RTGPRKRRMASHARAASARFGREEADQEKEVTAAVQQLHSTPNLGETAMTPSKKTGRLRLDQIKTTFFVRRQLNPDRVTYFRQLYESGQEVPIIEVTEETHQ